MNLEKIKKILSENWGTFKEKELYLHSKRQEPINYLHKVGGLNEGEDVYYTLELCKQDCVMCEGEAPSIDSYINTNMFTQIKIHTHHRVGKQEHISPSAEAISNFGTNK